MSTQQIPKRKRKNCGSNCRVLFGREQTRALLAKLRPEFRKAVSEAIAAHNASVKSEPYLGQGQAIKTQEN